MGLLKAPTFEDTESALLLLCLLVSAHLSLKKRAPIDIEHCG